MSSRLVQRLVGVAVLAALVVVFLPMVLDLDGTYRLDTHTKIPPQPTIEPIEIAEPVRVEGLQTPKNDEQIFQIGTDEINADQKDNEKPITDTAEAPALSSDGIPVAWILQVGSFKEKNKADTLTQQLLSDGYKAYARLGPSAEGNVYRVYVGPDILKEKLLADLDAIEKRYQIKPLLRHFEP